MLHRRCTGAPGLLAVAMEMEKQEPADANGFFKEKEDQVTVLGMTERNQSKMMVMFTVDPLSFWVLSIYTPVYLGGSPQPVLLDESRAHAF